MHHGTDSTLDCFISVQINLMLCNGCCRLMVGCVRGSGPYLLQFTAWQSLLQLPGLCTGQGAEQEALLLLVSV